MGEGLDLALELDHPVAEVPLAVARGVAEDVRADVGDGRLDLAAGLAVLLGLHDRGIRRLAADEVLGGLLPIDADDPDPTE